MKNLFILLSFLLPLAAGAQKKQPFKAYIYNKVYDIYMSVDFYSNSITVPGHELYGELPGYLGKRHNSYSWVITDCKLKNDRQADIMLINDTGSEDLTATLTVKNDTTYVLRQMRGSTLKVPNKGKWQKLPTEVTFIKKMR
ncbi:MAG: hypothetical protein J6C05_09610 [Prevotella sp.]|nr:hypothetical protein [Prevotella sp.]MBO5157361.1 hypothetical protein [Prevotella sp.]